MSRLTETFRLALAVAGAIAVVAGTAPVTASDEGAGEPARALHRLFDEAWQMRLEEDPLLATNVGDHRFNDRLPSVSEADEERRAAIATGFLERLATIDRERLGRSDQISYSMFERTLEERLAEHRFRSFLMPLRPGSSFYTSFPQLPSRTPFATAGDYEAYVSRLAAFLPYARQHVELMRTGIAEGRVPPRITLTGFAGELEPHIVDDPEKSLLWDPFADLRATLPAPVRERLAAAGRRAIAESVVPAYRELLAFLRDEYVPAAREDVGAWALPDGEDFYGHRVRRFTTLDLTPREVHETGLAEVARIRREMQAIIAKVGFEGSFDEFLGHLRSDERFYVDTPEELLAHVALILKRMDGELPKLFKTLPRTPYGIKPVPDYIAPKIYTAYYEPPAGDGSRAGFYAVNTYDLPSRPLYEYEALSFHEAVPGHHLQNALARELEEVPMFRRFGGISAFGEGWALYAERLGLEVGFYQDPYSDFGRLTYEMWRACRLVVDTGLHAMRWSRRQAIDYMAANTGLSLHNITTEVDRYIAWPGQALAYKTGELKIRALRAEAEEALGERFDLREFHDVVLGSGPVPLTVLEENVGLWIEERRAE